jgi:ppGpp synthetase/RelA/SpoT-type nucleotidyltranferase
VTEPKLDLSEDELSIDGMAWPTPKFSRNRVDAAGLVLLNNDEWGQYLLWDDLDDALQIINNWRSSHAYPLQVVKMNLKRRALSVDPAALVAQRLKRIEAIKMKMERNKKAGFDFGLSTMQDLGGCRAVMSSVQEVEKLARVFEEADSRSPERGSVLAKPFDYIRTPKADGYRGMHRVYRYRSQTKTGIPAEKLSFLSRFNGLKIEIQLRSILQHQWASAVETAGRYTRQDIKGSAGEEKWARFFALTSSAIAVTEDRPLVPGTPANERILRREILKFKDQLSLLKRYTAPIQSIPSGGVKGADMFILLVDPDSRKLEARPFKKKRLIEAQDAYFDAERSIRNRDGVEAVLVEVDSPEMLSVAYPSYYLDARDFVKTVEAFLG